MSRLTWRNEPNEQGIAMVGQRPRGRIGKVEGQDVARVMADGGGWARPLKGWYWWGWDRNSLHYDPPYPTKEEAQAAATSYYNDVVKKATP